MNEKKQPFEYPFIRATISFTLAVIAAKMTFIPFIALVYFEKVLPEWVKVSVLILGISLALYVGIKCFRWLCSYFKNL